MGTLSLDSFGFIGSSNTGSGAAGSVFIRVDDQIVLRHGSVITTSAEQADAGVIDIESGGTLNYAIAVSPLRREAMVAALTSQLRAPFTSRTVT